MRPASACRLSATQMSTHISALRTSTYIQTHARSNKPHSEHTSFPRSGGVIRSKRDERDARDERRVTRDERREWVGFSRGVGFYRGFSGGTRESRRKMTIADITTSRPKSAACPDPVYAGVRNARRGSERRGNESLDGRKNLAVPKVCLHREFTVFQAAFNNGAA